MADNRFNNSKDEFEDLKDVKSILHTEIINVKLPAQKLLFTQCIIGYLKKLN